MQNKQLHSSWLVVEGEAAHTTHSTTVEKRFYQAIIEVGFNKENMYCTGA